MILVSRMPFDFLMNFLGLSALQLILSAMKKCGTDRFAAQKGAKSFRFLLAFR